MAVNIKDLGVVEDGAIKYLHVFNLEKNKYMAMYPVRYDDLSAKMRRRIDKETRKYKGSSTAVIDPWFTLMNDIIPNTNLMETRAMLDVALCSNGDIDFSATFPIDITSAEMEKLLNESAPVVDKLRAGNEEIYNVDLTFCEVALQ